MYSSPNQQLLCQHSTKAARSDIEYAMQFSYVVIPNTGVFSVYLMDLSFDDCTIPVVLRVGGLRFMYL